VEFILFYSEKTTREERILAVVLGLSGSEKSHRNQRSIVRHRRCAVISNCYCY